MSKILILDGGLGTSLEKSHGVKFDSSTPLWSTSLLVTSPSTLLACQSSFGDIPVDVLLTATYQLSIKGFAATKTAERPDGFARDEIAGFVDGAVSIAKNAVKGDGQKVALSVGPYGACMVPSQEYSGRYDDEHDGLEKLQQWHRERLGIMGSPADIASRIGYVALETIPRLDEITAMRSALGSTAGLAGVPYWTCCLFPNPTNNTLPDGSSVVQAVRAMLDPSSPSASPWGIGINCTKANKLESLLIEYEAAVAEVVADKWITEWPALVLYPDGTNGEVYNTTTQTWDMPEGAGGDTGVAWEDVVATAVRGTQDRGKWRQIVVGGCCMASAEHIKRLRRALAQA